MKEYIKQIYTEGLATTFYLKPIKFLEKRISNKNLLKFLSILIKVIYTILIMTFAIYYVYQKLT